MQPSAVFKKSSFYKFGTNLFLVILLGAIISSLILYFVFPKELPSTYTAALRELQKLEESLYLKTYLIYLPVAVFIFIGVMALIQSLTKKIVTPLKAISDFSAILGSGDFSKRPPLEGADLFPLTPRLNELIDVYQVRLSSVKEAVAKLEAIQKDIGNRMDKNAHEEIRAELKELMETTKQIDRILDKIRA